MGEGIYAMRYGRLYCPRLITCRVLFGNIGAIRASLVHYNTTSEMDGFLEAIPRTA